MILLGFEIGTGKRVEIPENGHLAWFGQTQLSGKTTALEAIAFRGALRAVAFVTKQGEGGFLTGRMIPPYFSEPTNDEEQPLWRWVKSILEASQQRKMNFEESWIIRACEDPRQANTLAEVHANIKSLLGGEGDYVEKGKGKKKKREWKYTRKPVSGMNAGVYTSLKAYFDIVMPQLARLPYTKKLALGPGLNVMDLRGYAMETQALVIRSVMEWVYLHEKNVRVIVPEAQDFVPQGKNSPVKMACETLVRKAGANRNFMWLDSQDMAAVDKFALRACSIVGIGVQTEMHEIDRALATTFTPTLRPIDIARLKIGEFFVRTPEARVAKVYVQPAWMDSELHAQAIAKGEESVAGARAMLRAFKERAAEVPTCSICGAAHRDDQCLKKEPSSPAPAVDAQPKRRAVPAPQMLQIQEREDAPGEDAERDEYEEDAASAVPGRDAGRIEAREPDAPEDAPISGAPVSSRDGAPRTEPDGESEETMPVIKTPLEIIEESLAPGVDSWVTAPAPWITALETLVREHRELIEAHDSLAAEVQRLLKVIKEGGAKNGREHGVSIPARSGEGAAGNWPRPGEGAQWNDAKEEIYRYVVKRATEDPGVLQILLERPELKVTIVRPMITVDGATLKGQLALMVKNGFFDKPATGNTAYNDLVRRGQRVSKPNVYRELDALANLGFITKESDGFQSVQGLKASIATAK